ncbi:hypothetical protein D3C75_1107860 [compost metagenome]
MFAKSLQITASPLSDKRLIVVLAQQCDSLMAQGNQMISGTKCASEVIKIEPGVRLRKLTAAQC